MEYQIKVIWADKVWNAVVSYGIGYVPTLDLTFAMTPERMTSAILGELVAV